MDRNKCCEIAIITVLALNLVVMAQPSLTIYNQDFTVVRQPLSLDLQRGTNELRVTDITAHMEADSVILRDPAGNRAIQILEQNYRADPVSQGLLLSLYEGKEIQFLARKQDKDESKLRSRKQDGTVEIRAVEHLYRWINWEIVEKSDTFLKTDSQTIEFRIQVPTGEERVITYKVHYTW